MFKLLEEDELQNRGKVIYGGVIFGTNFFLEFRRTGHKHCRISKFFPLLGFFILLGFSISFLIVPLELKNKIKIGILRESLYFG